jgi:hypothetical protein
MGAPAWHAARLLARPARPGARCLHQLLGCAGTASLARGPTVLTARPRKFNRVPVALAAGPDSERGCGLDPALVTASAARLEAVAAAGLQSLPRGPAPGPAALDATPAEPWCFARLAAAHAGGAALGSAAALLDLRCLGAGSAAAASGAGRVGEGAAAGGPDPGQAGRGVAGAMQAPTAAGGAGAAAGSLRAGGDAPQAGAAAAGAGPEAPELAGPLLGSLGAHLRAAAGLLCSQPGVCGGSHGGGGGLLFEPAVAGAGGLVSSAGFGSGRQDKGLEGGPVPWRGPAQGLPLAAALRGVAFLEAAGRALGCFHFIAPPAEAACPARARCGSPARAARHGTSAPVERGEQLAAAAGVGADGPATPARGAFGALLALHLHLLRVLVPPPPVRALSRTRRTRVPERPARRRALCGETLRCAGI